MHGSWESHTGGHTALYPRKDETEIEKTLNVDFAINYWLKNGMPKEKINMGLAFFGRSFKLVNPENNHVGAPATGTGISGPVSEIFVH